jgi:hypothetical protein
MRDRLSAGNKRLSAGKCGEGLRAMEKWSWFGHTNVLPHTKQRHTKIRPSKASLSVTLQQKCHRQRRGRRAGSFSYSARSAAVPGSQVREVSHPSPKRLGHVGAHCAAVGRPRRLEGGCWICIVRHREVRLTLFLLPIPRAARTASTRRPRPSSEPALLPIRTSRFTSSWLGFPVFGLAPGQRKAGQLPRKSKLPGYPARSAAAARRA